MTLSYSGIRFKAKSLFSVIFRARDPLMATDAVAERNSGFKGLEKSMLKIAENDIVLKASSNRIFGVFKC